MDTPVNHPLLPLLWQKFFTLYLARVSISTSDKSCVGDKFFEGIVNFTFLKRMKKKLQDTVDFYQDKLNNFDPEDDASKKNFIASCLKY